MAEEAECGSGKCRKCNDAVNAELKVRMVVYQNQLQCAEDKLAEQQCNKTAAHAALGNEKIQQTDAQYRADKRDDEGCHGFSESVQDTVQGCGQI